MHVSVVTCVSVIVCVGSEVICGSGGFISGMGLAGTGCINASKKPLSMNIGLSCSSWIRSNANFIMVTGSLVSQFWHRNSKASLFSWYPAAIVA